jgi:hypothetical protein
MASGISLLTRIGTLNREGLLGGRRFLLFLTLS